MKDVLWLLWILLALLIVIVLIVWTKITLFVDLHHVRDNDYYRVRLRAWFGLIRYTYEIPVVKVKKDSPRLLVEKKKGMGDQGKEDENSWSDYSVEDGLSMLENAKQFLEQVVGFHKIFRRFLQKVTVRDIKWHSRFGLGDAALTGILTGAVWSAKGSVVGIISRYMKLKDMPVMSVTPVFQHLWSETVFECIISFRVGQAILVGLRTLRYWRHTSKKRRKRWKSSNKNKTHSVKT